nr:reverse transcriptase domain-containing protein [Tanacetum cinerariifolium]
MGLASLNRFLSKSAEKSLPFFKTLKKYTKKSDFQWTAKAETAFKQMKTLITELPMLTALKEKEELVIYPAAANEAVSTVLMTKGNGKQMPIYFISRALQGPKINYTLMEKLILALTKNISQATDSSRFHCRASEGRSSEYTYEKQGGTFGSVDTVHKWIIMHRRFDSQPPDIRTNRSEKSASECRFQACGQSSKWNLRSKGAIRDQIVGKDQKPRQCFQRVLHQTSTQRREQKSRCAEQDGIHNFAHLSKQILVEELKEKSIDKKEVLAIVEEKGHTWMTPIYEYLTEVILLEEKRKARAIRRKTGRYVVTNEILYKRSFLEPWLRCVGPLQANYALREIHEGSCSMHADPRSVVAKALRLGNREAPFSLTYGMKAMIPIEIGMPILRTAKIDMIKNDEALEINLGLLEEKKE